MRRHRWVLLAYLALSLLLTWPLVTQLATHVPGDGIDDPALAWNLWWAKHALVDKPQNPFDCTWMFWPVGINLAFYTVTLLNGVLSIPIQAVAGIVPAYNLLLLASFTLGGYGAYLLCLDTLHRRRPGGLSRRVGGREDGGAFAAASPEPAQGAAGWPAYLGEQPGLNERAAFVGGLLYGFASAKLFYAALGQANIASSQWAPFVVYYTLRTCRFSGRPRDAALAALFLILQAYAELTYASFLLIFVAMAAVWALLARPNRSNQPAEVAGLRSEKATEDYDRLLPRQDAASEHPAVSTLFTPRPLVSYLSRVFLLIALFTLGIAPILANMLPDLSQQGDLFAGGGGFADIFSADLAGFALPTQLHPLLGGAIRQLTNNSTPLPDGTLFPVDKGQQIYPGYVALALVLVGAGSSLRRTQAAPVSARAMRAPAQSLPVGNLVGFWSLAALSFFVLTLGPSLRLAGHVPGVPLPFALLARLPFFEGNRYPSRYGVMLLLCLAPLVALGARSVFSALYHRQYSVRVAGVGFSFPIRFSRCLPPTTVLLSVALLFEHLSIPLPLSDLRVPAMYTRVAALPGDFALLELPLGWRNGARVAGKQDVVIMSEQWAQTIHGKRILGGNTSRNAEFKFQYFSEDPTLGRFIALTNAADLPQHTALRAELVSEPINASDRTRARDWAAMLDIRYVMVHRDKVPAEVEVALQDLLPVTLMAEDGLLALYEVAPSAAPAVYRPGTTQDSLILGEGWSPPGFVAPLPGAATPPVPVVWAQGREARLLLPLAPEAASVMLAGWAVAPDQQVTVQVDGRLVGTQELPLRLTVLTFSVPGDPSRPPVSEVILRFAAEIPLKSSDMPSLLVRSAGQETGDFGHIYLDGREVSRNQRGYNLVALTPGGGVLASEAFDTHATLDAGDSLARWVASLPAGTTVAGAVRDEGSQQLSESAVIALRSLGVTTDLRGRFRWGHAFISMTGAAPGTAVEAVDGIHPAQVSRGLAVSAPRLAAALVEVAIGN